MAKRVNAAFAAAMAKQDAEKRNKQAARRKNKACSTETLQQIPTMRERFEDWKINRAHRFSLVQRLNPNKRPGRGWFGGKFELDYMGSSEFEFGASHYSLKRMREAGHFVIDEVLIEFKGVRRCVYFIGSSGGEYRETMERKISDFRTWLENGLPSKEWTDFPELFTGDFGCRSPEYIDTIAWWSFDADIMWSLDLEVAEQLLYGLQNPAQA